MNELGTNDSSESFQKKVDRLGDVTRDLERDFESEMRTLTVV